MSSFELTYFLLFRKITFFLNRFGKTKTLWASTSLHIINRDDGPYYDLRTVLENNSYTYPSDFAHYEDNYRAQQEFYDERATDSDNTLSTDESSFSSRQRFMLPLDTIEEIEESPRATEEFGQVLSIFVAKWNATLNSSIFP